MRRLRIICVIGSWIIFGQGFLPPALYLLVYRVNAVVECVVELLKNVFIGSIVAVATPGREPLPFCVMLCQDLNFDCYFCKYHHRGVGSGNRKALCLVGTKRPVDFWNQNCGTKITGSLFLRRYCRLHVRKEVGGRHKPLRASCYHDQQKPKCLLPKSKICKQNSNHSGWSHFRSSLDNF